jgi:hypothetical protein
MLRPTASRPVYLGIRPHLGPNTRLVLLSFRGLLIWTTLSDEITDLSFIIAACPRQRSHSRVPVPRDSWPYFTISDRFETSPTNLDGQVPMFICPKNRSAQLYPQALDPFSSLPTTPTLHHLPGHSLDSSIIVGCVLVAAETCLLSRRLAVEVSASFLWLQYSNFRSSGHNAIWAP